VYNKGTTKGLYIITADCRGAITWRLSPQILSTLEKDISHDLLPWLTLLAPFHASYSCMDILDERSFPAEAPFPEASSHFIKVHAQLLWLVTVKIAPNLITRTF
jgi:hypothetical protein